MEDDDTLPTATDVTRKITNRFPIRFETDFAFVCLFVRLQGTSTVAALDLMADGKQRNKQKTTKNNRKSTETNTTQQNAQTQHNACNRAADGVGQAASQARSKARYAPRRPAARSYATVSFRFVSRRSSFVRHSCCGCVALMCFVQRTRARRGSSRARDRRRHAHQFSPR